VENPIGFNWLERLWPIWRVRNGVRMAEEGEFRRWVGQILAERCRDKVDFLDA
jgi:hypothetical protein